MKRLLFLILTLLVAGSASAATKVQVMTDGVIDVDRLPTISFFQEGDPAEPELGQMWWNNATNQLKVAGALGVYAFNSTSLVEWDTTPAAFSFTDVTNATTNSTYVSAPITVSGINWPAPISVSGDASAKYSVNNATATAVNGTVASGDSVRAVVTSSASASTAVNATVVIGGVSDAYSVTTGTAESGDPVAAYVGWDNTDGTPTGAPAGAREEQLITYLQKWEADADGEVDTVNIYVGNWDLTPRAEFVVVYKDIEGVLTLIGYGSYSGVKNAWTGAIELTAASGQTLEFVAGDDLYFGGSIAASSTSGQKYGLGRDTTGGTGAYYFANQNVTSGPKATLPSPTYSANLKLGGILKVLQ